MRILIEILAVWFALNLGIAVFIVWQRSPHLRRRQRSTVPDGLSSQAR